jgi:hypothetical protein
MITEIHCLLKTKLVDENEVNKHVLKLKWIVPYIVREMCFVYVNMGHKGTIPCIYQVNVAFILLKRAELFKTNVHGYNCAPARVSEDLFHYKHFLQNA